MKRKFQVFSFVLAFCFILSACKQQSTDKIVFESKYLSISGYTCDEFLLELEECNSLPYVNAYSKEDFVCVEITEEQNKKWQAHQFDLKNELVSDFVSKNNKYKLLINDEYTEINIYYDLNCDAYEATKTVLYAETICATMQKLVNNVGENWFVKINIYNCNTGKIVVSGDSQSPLEYSDENWEDSN